MKSLVDLIKDGFESAESEKEEADLMLAQIVAEAEYQSCLAELQSSLI